MLRKILKVIGIGIIFAIGLIGIIILSEYLYANRWVFYRNVPELQYEEIIIGEWHLVEKTIFDYDFGYATESASVYREYMESGDYDRYCVGACDNLNTYLGWKVNQDNIIINYIRHPRVIDKPELINQPLEANYKILKLNKKYLVTKLETGLLRGGTLIYIRMDNQ